MKHYWEKTDAEKQKVIESVRASRRRAATWKAHWQQVALYRYYLEHFAK